MKVGSLKSVLVAIGVVTSIPALGTFPGGEAREPVKKGKPNIIIIMTDDQGYGELSCYGNPVLKTPELDWLHDNSIRFTDFHVTPMCAPTRGQLLTGVDAARNGAVNVSSGRGLMRTEIPSMAELFSANGYSTGLFGKWHLGDNYPFRPGDRGFDEALWFPSSHISSVPDYWGNDYFDDTYIHNDRREVYKGYCTDVFFDESMQWISECAGEKRPFLAYISTNAPHYPHFAPEKDISDMQQVIDASVFSGLKPGTKNPLIRYLAMIRNIDENVGKLVGFLDEQGLADNTILIFLTDNGSTFGPRYYNAGMRGMKTEMYEGGHRVPLFIRWPAGNFTSPRDMEGLTTVQDILPTLVDLCGIRIADSVKFDGVSLAPVLRGNEKVDGERMVIINYSRMPIGFDYPSPHAPSIVKKDDTGVLWKEWRLLENRGLYNLEKDPMQQENVIGQYPEIAEKMRSYLNRWWTGVRDQVNEPQRVVIGNEKENPILLTACEWMDVFVDQKAQVMKGVRKNSYWEMMVDQAGTYELELRRWPVELDLPIRESIEGGVALPITTARLLISGVRHVDVIAPFTFEGAEQKVEPDDKASVFTVDLEAGPATLHTWFNDKDKNTLCGAYYVYIRRVDI
ncbi:MAG: arylsulfatase [Bacteroidales bacterium]